MPRPELHRDASGRLIAVTADGRSEVVGTRAAVEAHTLATDVIYQLGKAHPSAQARTAAVAARRKESTMPATVNDAPRTVDQFQAVLNNSTTLDALFRSGTFNSFVCDYAKAIARADPSLRGGVDNQKTSVMTRMIGGPFDASYTEQGLRNKALPMAAADGELLNFAELFQAAAPKHVNLTARAELDKRRAKLATIQRNAYSGQVPSAGGFLIPEEFRSELLEIAAPKSIVRPRATVLPMGSLYASWPKLESEDRSDGPFGGLVKAYWTPEGGAIPDSGEAKFGRIRLEAVKLALLTALSNDVIADAPLLRSILKRILPDVVSWYEDLAFTSGTGTGEPLGWNGHSSQLVIAKESGQAADTIVAENILAMYARMLPDSLGSAVWLASQDTLPELMTMGLQIGMGGTSLVWIGERGLASAPPVTIMGRPVIFTEKVPKLGDEGDLSFVDLSYYLIGDRQAVEIDASAHSKFGNDQTEFRLIERVDGRPWLDSPVTPANGGPTLSPFVRLGERA